MVVSGVGFLRCGSLHRNGEELSLLGDLPIYNIRFFLFRVLQVQINCEPSIRKESLK